MTERRSPHEEAAEDAAVHVALLRLARESVGQARVAHVGLEGLGFWHARGGAHRMRKPPKTRPCMLRCCGWHVNVLARRVSRMWALRVWGSGTPGAARTA